MERSDTHLGPSQQRWVSLRSIHPPIRFPGRHGLNRVTWAPDPDSGSLTPVLVVAGKEHSFAEQFYARAAPVRPEPRALENFTLIFH